MKDLTGREISINDTIAFYSNTFKKMYRGNVYNLGEKMVCITYSPYETSSLNDPWKHKVYPTNCVIIESEDRTTLAKIPRTI